MRLPSMLALLLVTRPVFAQAPAVAVTPAAQSASVTLLGASSGAGCPVVFSASRLPNGGMMQAGPASQTRRQALRLAFSPSASRSIVQANITLRGIAGHHVVFADEANATNSTETFSLALSPNNRLQNNPLRLDSVVYPRKLTGVLFVELNSLTYADGTQWHASAEAPCRVAPNGFQLVAASR